MLLRGFQSRLGLESSGFSMWHFLKLVAMGFRRVLRFLPSLLHGAAQMFIMVDRIWEMTVKKSNKYGEYGSLKYLLFLFVFIIRFLVYLFS